MVNSEKGGSREQELEVPEVPDPREALSNENKALLSFFASEVARYLEISLGNRLDQLESDVCKLGSMDSSNADAVTAIREIIQLFSKYKLFRILQALSEMAANDQEFTKNTLIRCAGVGQGFRNEGLNRLVEILCYRGLLMEVGRRGRGILYRVTGSGSRFFQFYLPGRSSDSSIWDDNI